MYQININGYILDAEPCGIRGNHSQYIVTLTTPEGSVLFGKDSDVVGIPLYRDDEKNVLDAALCLVTLQHGDTDDEFFADDTELETAWRNDLCVNV